MMSLWSQKNSCKICGDLWLILTTNFTNYTIIFFYVESVESCVRFPALTYKILTSDF